MSEKTVRVELDARSYPIHIGSGIWEQYLLPLTVGAEVALMVDDNVAAQPWFAALRTKLTVSAAKFVLLSVVAGEKTKNLSVFSQLCSELARAKISRRGKIIAVGGGVVGDLAGFVAASYLRGIALVQVPTSLLAAVDSSVGGKTGVNLPEGKNLVGAFCQPVAVIIDLDFLQTLPSRELAAGMAEVVKYGIIRDPEFFELVKNGAPRDLSRVIEKSVLIKAGVVANDEREETGLRAMLNFGHTIGHAIEQTTGYGQWLHGEAVSVGMIGAAWLSHRLVGLPLTVTREIYSALVANKLPVTISGLDFARLAPVIAMDKKSTGKSVNWVLCPELGRTTQNNKVPDEMLREAIEICAGRKAI
ncbi:MAG: 3-dehydroquinate synthase [Verrucomicrobiales bacterium]|jgi:3-dehydroquinate synthase|nr:3-dehydroquinate synthase [Verrucomicrobiales bacterium]